MKTIINIIIILVLILGCILIVRYNSDKKDSEISEIKAQNSALELKLGQYTNYLFELENEAKNNSKLIAKQVAEIDGLRKAKAVEIEKPKKWNDNENLAFYDSQTGEGFKSKVHNDSVIVDFQRIPRSNTKFIHFEFATQEINKIDSMIALQEIRFANCNKQNIIKDSIIDIRELQYSNALFLIKKQDDVILKKDRRIKIERIVSGSIIVIIAAITLF